MDTPNAITVAEILKIVGLIAGGSLLPTLAKLLFGFESSKIKSLNEIITQLDKRVQSQDDKIDKLEKKVETLGSEKFMLLTKIERYKYAAEGLKMCPFYQQTGDCVMKQRYHMIKDEETQ